MEKSNSGVVIKTRVLFIAAAIAAPSLVDADDDVPIAKITPELRLRLDASPQALFAILDTNDDGLLDENEAAYDVSLRDVFGAADTNTDNRINEREYREFHEAWLSRSTDP